MRVVENLIKLPLLVCAYLTMRALMLVFGEERLDQWSGYTASRKGQE